MLNNTMYWYFSHKKLVVLILTMLTAITTAALIFAHDCYSSSLYKDREGEYKIRLTQPISLDEFEKSIVLEANNSGIDFQYLNVGFGRGSHNTVCYSTYLSKPKARYMYGSLPENPAEVMQYVSVVSNAESEIHLFGNEYIVTGCGLLEYCDADYALYPSDYKANVGAVEYFSAKITGANENTFRNLVEKTLGNAEIRAFTGINFDSVMSRKNVIISYLILIAVSIVFAAIIVKIVIDMQKKDIFIYYVCGGNMRKITCGYWASSMLLTVIAEILGTAVFLILKSLGIFTYSEYGPAVPIALVLFVQSVSAAVSLYVSAKSVCKKLQMNYKEVLS